MANLLTRFFRKISYCEELQAILVEEEKLLQKIRNRYSSAKIHGVPYDSSFSYEYRHDVFEYWREVAYLQRESRKLEELKRLLAIEENKLTQRDIKAIEQIRSKFDRRPLLLLKKEECYCNNGKFDTAKYKAIQKELIKNEIRFWEGLFQTNRETRKNALLFLKDITFEIRESKRLMQLVSANDPKWKDEIKKFDKRLYEKHGMQFLESLYDELDRNETAGLLRHLELFEHMKFSREWERAKEALEITKKIDRRLKQSQPS